MDLRGLGSSGPSALICWGRYGSYMPVAGFVLRTSSRLAVDAGRLSVRAIPRTLMPAFRQSAMLMRSSWLRYLELIFWGMSTVERYQSTDGFSFLPFDRVLPLRHTLPVRLDTPTARAACVKFMPASRCSTYRRRRAAHISPRVAYSTPSNTHLSTWPSHQSARRCDDHWNPPYWIGEPYWGQGLIPEAGREILHHGFEDLQLTAIWGVHDVNNHKSSRVMDKLGLAPVRTARHVHLKLLGDVYRDELVRRITADEWLTR